MDKNRNGSIGIGNAVEEELRRKDIENLNDEIVKSLHSDNWTMDEIGEMVLPLNGIYNLDRGQIKRMADLKTKDDRGLMGVVSNLLEYVRKHKLDYESALKKLEEGYIKIEIG